jgi:murein DD-endopeptidase MepM/ murein hydrolase activator NlpD
MLRKIASREFSDAATRGAILAAAVTALLLSAPVLDQPFEPRQSPDMVPVSPASQENESQVETEARVQARLKRGDTLLALLARYGVNPPSAHELLERVRPFLNPRKLQPGKAVELVLHPQDQSVQAMEVRLENNIIRATSVGGEWFVERHEIPSVKELRVVSGTIEDNLYMSGLNAGLTPEHVAQLEDIFKYDIDFFSDFVRGDDFSAVLEQIRYEDGRQVPRRVLAADLQAGGKVFSAFYFVPKNGKGSYYDEEGKQLRNAFLRAPLSFTRISSPYSLARRHPITRTLRPHRAIDYAAPSGTPVLAIGSGRVSFSGWRPGYGNLVEISHPGGYSSRYGHFSRIPRGIRRGVEISAGDVIGYVGQTGHATGPHLHFEFLRGGQKIDFLTTRIPRAERLAGGELQRFMRERDERLAQLRNEIPATEKSWRM